MVSCWAIGRSCDDAVKARCSERLLANALAESGLRAVCFDLPERFDVFVPPVFAGEALVLPWPAVERACGALLWLRVEEAAGGCFAGAGVVCP